MLRSPWPALFLRCESYHLVVETAAIFRICARRNRAQNRTQKSLDSNRNPNEESKRIHTHFHAAAPQLAPSELCSIRSWRRAHCEYGIAASFPQRNVPASDKHLDLF